MENDVFENIIIDNENNEISDEIIDTESLQDVGAFSDYYDNYYNLVLQKLDNLTTQQNTIIQNQQSIIGCNQQQNTSFNVICFLLGVIVCYMFIKTIFNLR